MKSRLFLLPILTFFIFAESRGQDKWQVADRQITRLAPGIFRELPKAIVRNLERRGCRVPQAFGEKARHNVISGEFARRGRRNWAILCSVGRTSSILIYWDATGKNVSRVASAPDRSFLQDVGGGQPGFSRAIEIADAKYIDDHYKSYGGRKPPRITHDGINDIYIEKASTVHYFRRRKWLELQGAD